MYAKCLNCLFYESLASANYCAIRKFLASSTKGKLIELTENCGKDFHFHWFHFLSNIVIFMYFFKTFDAFLSYYLHKLSYSKTQMFGIELPGTELSTKWMMLWTKTLIASTLH